ncbi:hypothetical protein COMA1_20291 [Candidatus Nitrospira nitrosa]|uniref:Uncharacterized protein n=1 Tax=Candidatus Nitrospira nitrosa TaxID=1742972 RepID=A0A0S4LCM0_9BACT|nr:hypothetical protein COMA1_20291 [Candidatus Nitrospira nitrosa]
MDDAILDLESADTIHCTHPYRDYPNSLIFLVLLFLQPPEQHIDNWKVCPTQWPAENANKSVYRRCRNRPACSDQRSRFTPISIRTRYNWSMGSN